MNDRLFPREKRAPEGRQAGRGRSRREVLALLSSAGAGMVLKSGAPMAQTDAKGPRIIDTHHHIYPPNYTKQNLERLVADTPYFSGALYTNWTPRVSLDTMDQNGVATVIASMTSPGVWFGNNEEGRKWARECNEYAAKLIKDYPGRFGMFAPIPLPDTEGSLREIEYALDVLKLDGIGLLTSYDNGKLLGHPQFAPVFEELNRRKAVVFVHPTMTGCGNPAPPMGAPSIEFPTDTTRTIASLVYSGTFVRFRDLRFIFSHGGGVLPSVASRIELAALNFTPEQRAAVFPKGLEYELQRHYYDIALSALSSASMAGVLKLFPTSQLLWGSDMPFIPMKQTAMASAKLGLPASEVRAIHRDNALGLFPRLKT